MNRLPSDARTTENALISKVDIFYLCDGKSDKCRKTACALEDHESTLVRCCMHTRYRTNSINYKDKAPTKEQLKAHFSYCEHQTADGQTVASYWEKWQDGDNAYLVRAMWGKCAVCGRKLKKKDTSLIICNKCRQISNLEAEE